MKQVIRQVHIQNSNMLTFMESENEIIVLKAEHNKYHQPNNEEPRLEPEIFSANGPVACMNLDGFLVTWVWG